MLNRILSTALCCTLAVSFACAQSVNKLTPAEKKEGWQLLFDGKTSKGWRGAFSKEFPKHGWVVENGTLTGKLQGGGESARAGDIITEKKYKDFELVFDWKLDSGGNSGVKYFILEPAVKPEKNASLIGYEYQLIDDAHYIYQGKPLGPKFKTASIYEVVAADKPDVKVGDWHTSRIRVKNNLIEHWLDGKKVLEVDRKSDRFIKGVADGKFRDHPGFATIPEGHILLQDHGHGVSFRNIKIRE